MIRLGAVGDVVRTLPAVSALRAGYPDAHLCWLVEPASQSVLEGQPWVDEVRVFPRTELRAALRSGRWIGAARGFAAFVGALRADRFDLVVDFHAILKSGALAWLSGAPQRVSYARPFAREGAAWFATERAALAPRRQSRFARNDALVRFLGVSEAPASEPLAVSPTALAWADEQLAGHPAPVVVHPGTSPGTEHKRWAPEGYASLAQDLAADGIETIVSFGPTAGEPEFARRIVELSRGAARLAPETPSLHHLAALFRRSRLYVGSDTGPMHVASLVGTPVVQLMGPTDPVENQPFPGTPSQTVREQIACNPCRRGCAAATCMRVIGPTEVARAARSLLAGG